MWSLNASLQETTFSSPSPSPRPSHAQAQNCSKLWQTYGQRKEFGAYKSKRKKRVKSRLAGSIWRMKKLPRKWQFQWSETETTSSFHLDSRFSADKDVSYQLSLFYVYISFLSLLMNYFYNIILSYTAQLDGGIIS